MIDTEGRLVKWIRDGKIRRTNQPVPTGDEWWLQLKPDSSFATFLRIEGENEVESRVIPYETVDEKETVVERTMTPFGDTVVVEPLPDFDPSSRIILPEGARVKYDRAKRAKIVDVGPDVRGLLPGQEVLVAPMHDGVEIDVPGTGKATGRFRVIQAKAVMAVLSTDPDPDVHVNAVDRLLGELSRMNADDAVHDRMIRVFMKHGWIYEA